MKHYLSASLIFIFLWITGQPQNPFPKGTYMYCEDLLNRRPSSYDTFDIRKRSEADIALMGGNDFNISSLSANLSNRKVNKEIFAISTGDSLYLNCYKLGLQPKYALAKVEGDYLIFNAGISTSTNSDILFIGGAINGAVMALKRYPYIMFLNGCRTTVLTRENFTYLLHPYPELYARFIHEKGKDSTVVLIRYYKEYINLISDK